ncbi:MAG: carboxypeptidase-like regulatory domain-containing protein [Planctomycetaceae bacterium]
MESLRKRCLVWIIAACLCMGCGGRGDRPELGTVTGTVFLDDQPLPNVWVMFNPTAGGRTSMARTNENGEYELMYLEGTKGANLGSHKVVIMTYHEDEIEEMRFNNEPVKEPILPRYNSQTTLTAEVKEGKNPIDFHLESK